MNITMKYKWLLLFQLVSASIGYHRVARELTKSENNTIILKRIFPKYVGQRDKVTIVPWTSHTLKVLSLKPPVFEVEHFLTNTECEYLIKEALKEGLQTSRIVGEQENITMDILSSFPYSDFENWDINDDGIVSFEESAYVFVQEFGISIANRTLASIGLDKDGDQKVTEREFDGRNLGQILDFIQSSNKKNTELKVRESNQAWLRRSGESKQIVMESIEKRLSKITGLPLEMIQTTEEMQVVRYEPGGHYNCHLDSDNINDSLNRPCCHISYEENCRICRYLTALYYLNHVTEGGETAFPIAETDNLNAAWSNSTLDICDLATHCKESALRVLPQKGKLVFWYNHVVNSSTQWMGQVDPFAHHGGCQVIKGTKWIANHWVDVSTEREEDENHWTSFFSPDSNSID